MKSKSADKKRAKPRRRVDLDGVLLRCATIERRLEVLETALDIQAQRLATMQGQIDQDRPGKSRA